MKSSNVWLALIFGCAFVALPPVHATTHDGSGQGVNHASASQASGSDHTGAIASSESSTSASGSSGTQAPSVGGAHASTADGGSCTDNAATSLPKGNADCAGNGGSSGSSSSTLGWQSLLPGSIQ